MRLKSRVEGQGGFVVFFVGSFFAVAVAFVVVFEVGKARKLKE